MQPIHTVTIYWLVGVSVLTSVVASYSAFGFAERMAKSKGVAHVAWLTGGALALGLGIWSMHYLGMLAVRLPIDVVYHLPTVMLSLTLAILSSCVVLIQVSRPQHTLWNIGWSGVLMGAGIGGMHYTGMHAMRCAASHNYRPTLVVTSVAIAVGLSWVALWAAFAVRTRTADREWFRLGGAIVMGLGISAMHYTAMTAVSFMPDDTSYSTSSVIGSTDLDIVAVILVTCLVLFGALITVNIDRRVHTRLAVERDRLHGASESSMDALFICDAVRDAKGEIEDFLFTYLNDNVEKMVSIPIKVLLGTKMCEMLPVNRALGLFDRYKQVVLTGQPMAYEFSVSDKHVRISWVRVQAVKLRDGVAITASDISERKWAEEKIVHMAHHDPLTGLPNRSLLNDRVQQAIERANRNSGKVGVFVVDLDGFKEVNDTLGHGAGDEVLVLTAIRIKSAVRASDSVIRTGGDEFVVVIADVFHEFDIQKCGEKIVLALSEPMEAGGKMVQITCSLGIAIYPDSADTARSLLTKADTAMYVAKHSGKDRLAMCSTCDFRLSGGRCGLPD
jgi:diguanylate cyclase (GGDEF)-like protein